MKETIVKIVLATVLLVAYFAAKVSFSKEGVWLGNRTWFQTAVTILAAFNFLASLSFFAHIHLFRWAGLLRFLVQPLSVYLLIVLVRSVGKRVCKRKWADTTWEEIINI